MRFIDRDLYRHRGTRTDLESASGEAWYSFLI
jgi:hypothetical protein